MVNVEWLRGLGEVLRDCDIVHSAELHLPFSEQAARLKDSLGFKMVLTCWENIPFLHDGDLGVRRRKKIVAGSVDQFVAVTATARDCLVAEGIDPSKIVVIPAGVDLDIFAPRARPVQLLTAMGLPADAVVCLYCGRLVPEKGVDDLLMSMATVTNADRMVYTVIVGDGPDELRLRHMCTTLGLDSRVVFAGPRQYAEMPAMYSMADLFVLPSLAPPYWREQFGMVLVEAMACALPVVTTRSGSIPDVVGDTATLVTPGRPTELAEALMTLASSSLRRRESGAASLARARQFFSAQMVASQLFQMYSGL